MAKTAQKEKSAPADNQGKKEKPAPTDNETKKQHKKQAKQEAKTMLKLEEAKRAEQKAEQKVVKAQANLVASRTHVQTLEAELAQVRSSQQSSHTDASKANFALQQELPDLNGHTQDNTQQDNTQQDNAQAPSTPSTSSEQSDPTSFPENQAIAILPEEEHKDIGQNQESAASYHEENALEQSSDEEAYQ